MQLDQRTLGRLIRMPFPELVCRGRQETRKLVDRVWMTRNAHVVSDRGANGLERFLADAHTHFFPGVFDDGIIDAIDSAQRASILDAANNALGGRLDLLGYAGLDFGERIDWHRDVVSGRRAPLVHWSRIDPLDAPTVGDSKVVWELNRHQWLIRLGQAWRLTRDERYANAIAGAIQDWLRENPVGMGINWASSLEVAFRLIAWSWAMLLIRDSSALTNDVFSAIEASIDAHATHVERYLSYYFSPNTHLTGEALGLYYAGTLYRSLRGAERWRRLGTRILIDEIERQILPDGVYMERSTCYQRYTADIYLHFVLLAGTDAPPVVRTELKSLLDVLIALRQPDGSMPDIGDADGGMLAPLSIAMPNDFGATFSTAAIVFRDPVYAWAACTVSPDTLWLLGTRGARTFADLEKHEPQSSTTHVFPAGGFVSMRSGWDERAHALVFDCGPLGCRYSGGHGHASLLSIQCSVFGEPFIVDSGTYCYTADRAMRDRFRSTQAHSTVTIDGRSQAQPRGPFSWHERCAAKLLRWTTNTVEGYSDAYKTVKHTRRIVFVDSRYWVILDDLCGKDTHRVEVRFQFAALNVSASGDGWYRAAKNDRALLVRAFASADFDAHIEDSRVSPNYGRIEAAPALVYTADTRLPLRFLTILWPADGETPFIELLNDASGRPTGVRTQRETVVFEEDEIHVRHRGNH